MIPNAAKESRNHPLAPTVRETSNLQKALAASATSAAAMADDDNMSSFNPGWNAGTRPSSMGAGRSKQPRSRAAAGDALSLFHSHCNLIQAHCNRLYHHRRLSLLPPPVIQVVVVSGPREQQQPMAQMLAAQLDPVIASAAAAAPTRRPTRPTGHRSLARLNFVVDRSCYRSQGGDGWQFGAPPSGPKRRPQAMRRLPTEIEELVSIPRFACAVCVLCSCVVCVVFLCCLHEA